MKNKLEITEFNDGLVANIKYKVHDAHKTYLITYNRAVAEKAYSILKTEYESTENAS